MYQVRGCPLVGFPVFLPAMDDRFHSSDRHQNEMVSGISGWKENLKENIFLVLLGSVAVSFLLGYFIAQQHETKKREQWAQAQSMIDPKDMIIRLKCDLRKVDLARLAQVHRQERNGASETTHDV
jgi:hypothetical protein